MGEKEEENETQHSQILVLLRMILLEGIETKKSLVQYRGRGLCLTFMGPKSSSQSSDDERNPSEEESMPELHRMDKSEATQRELHEAAMIQKLREVVGLALAIRIEINHSVRVEPPIHQQARTYRQQDYVIQCRNDKRPPRSIIRHLNQPSESSVRYNQKNKRPSSNYNVHKPRAIKIRKS